MVSLIPAVPLGAAQDSKCDLLRGCGDIWHRILSLVRQDGQLAITFFMFFLTLGAKCWFPLWDCIIPLL